MSLDKRLDVDKYREDHESDEHWELRRAFMEKWKNDYPEDRLVCLARVFANIEFMGCRYPIEVMQEVARLSHDVSIIAYKVISVVFRLLSYFSINMLTLI